MQARPSEYLRSQRLSPPSVRPFANLTDHDSICEAAGLARLRGIMLAAVVGELTPILRRLLLDSSAAVHKETTQTTSRLKRFSVRLREEKRVAHRHRGPLPGSPRGRLLCGW